MAKDDKAVAVTDNGAGALATADDFAEFDGGGFENQDNTDILIPFLKVLQSGSPQVKKSSGEKVEGAEEGFLFNSVTNDVFDGDKGVLFVAGTTERVFNEWIPKAEDGSGGGFVGQFGPNDKAVVDAIQRNNDEDQKFGKYTTLPNLEGNQLVETYYIYGVLCPENEEPQPITIACTSTKIKSYKKWNSALRMFTIPTSNGRKLKPPIFSALTRVTTVPQTNGTYDSYNIILSPANGEVKNSVIGPKDERFQAAKAMGDLVRSGVAKLDMNSGQDAESTESAAEAGKGKPPF